MTPCEKLLGLIEISLKANFIFSLVSYRLDRFYLKKPNGHKVKYFYFYFLIAFSKRIFYKLIYNFNHLLHLSIIYYNIDYFSCAFKYINSKEKKILNNTKFS